MTAGNQLGTPSHRALRGGGEEMRELAKELKWAA